MFYDEEQRKAAIASIDSTSKAADPFDSNRQDQALFGTHYQDLSHRCRRLFARLVLNNDLVAKPTFPTAGGDVSIPSWAFLDDSLQPVQGEGPWLVLRLDMTVDQPADIAFAAVTNLSSRKIWDRKLVRAVKLHTFDTQHAVVSFLYSQNGFISLQSRAASDDSAAADPVANSRAHELTMLIGNSQLADGSFMSCGHTIQLPQTALKSLLPKVDADTQVHLQELINQRYEPATVPISGFLVRPLNRDDSAGVQLLDADDGVSDPELTGVTLQQLGASPLSPPITTVSPASSATPSLDPISCDQLIDAINNTTPGVNLTSVARALCRRLHSPVTSANPLSPMIPLSPTSAPTNPFSSTSALTSPSSPARHIVTAATTLTAEPSPSELLASRIEHVLPRIRPSAIYGRRCQITYLAVIDRRLFRICVTDLLSEHNLMVGF